MSLLLVFWSSSLAPCTTAPVASVTVPAMDAENVCARATWLIKIAKSTPRTSERPRRRHDSGSEPMLQEIIRQPPELQASEVTNRTARAHVREENVGAQLETFHRCATLLSAPSPVRDGCHVSG